MTTTTTTTTTTTRARVTGQKEVKKEKEKEEKRRRSWSCVPSPCSCSCLSPWSWTCSGWRCCCCHCCCCCCYCYYCCFGCWSCWRPGRRWGWKSSWSWAYWTGRLNLVYIWTRHLWHSENKYDNLEFSKGSTFHVVWDKQSGQGDKWGEMNQELPGRALVHRTVSKEDSSYLAESSGRSCSDQWT